MTKRQLQTQLVHEDVEFKRQDQLPFEVEVLKLEELLKRALPHDITKAQRIHFNAIVLIEDGDSYHDVDFNRYPTSEGHLIIVPATHVQAFSSEKTLKGYMILFTPEFLNGCSIDIKQLMEASQSLLSAGPLVKLQENSQKRIKDVIQALDQYTRFPPANFSEKAISAAFSLLIFTLAGLQEIRDSIATHVPRDKMVSRFLRSLEESFASEHQATYYADALHISQRSLDRHLVRHLSLTTRQAISARLILEAKRLLTEREMLVKNIAYDLGFSEPQNFTRFFRTQTGYSPEAFRQKLDSLSER